MLNPNDNPQTDPPVPPTDPPPTDPPPTDPPSDPPGVEPVGSDFFSKYRQDETEKFRTENGITDKKLSWQDQLLLQNEVEKRINKRKDEIAAEFPNATETTKEELLVGIQTGNMALIAKAAREAYQAELEKAQEDGDEKSKEKKPEVNSEEATKDAPRDVSSAIMTAVNAS